MSLVGAALLALSCLGAVQVQVCYVHCNLEIIPQCMGDPQYSQLSCPKTANDPTVLNPLQEEHGQKGGRWAVAVDCVKIIHQKRHVLCRQMSAANVELQNGYIMLDHCKLPSVRMSAKRFHLFTFSTYPLGTMVNQSANSGASLWSISNPSYFSFRVHELVRSSI